ncbi:MAG: hypothetical protein HLUCCX14_15410 [Marinobacter excellens HL-55]|uniref:DUF6671 domain-containing protein n=1 Tax=Marinobacter excellens HL-55 TaxID=1305731 RepID=A0A0P8CV47_9GAMM|nr:MAG: hypothetical protein HLUCCX14_15410 [Marinobacter excellens HL-55]
MTIWNGRAAILLTQHQKLPAVSPALASLGIHVTGSQVIDTDTLGTFTRDIDRVASQRETALKKATIAANQKTGCLGLGSEGAFGGGFFCINLEIVCLFDPKHQLVLYGEYSAPFGLEQSLIGSKQELLEILDRCPVGQGLVMRPERNDHPEMHKGLSDREHIIETYERMKRQSASGQIFVEYDLRAHQSVNRMANIRKAAENLGEKMQSFCPGCQSAGFWMTAIEPGLRCRDCDAPTDRPKAAVWSCPACNYQEARPVKSETTGPEFCPYCNP